MTVTDESLELCELFVSIAGESSQAGRPAVFVRLAGCNLRCRWCDTQYAWQPGVAVAQHKLLADVLAQSWRLVIITGGEPLRQPGTPAFCAELLRAGRQVMVETNGSQDISVLPPRVRVVMDMKAPSSGESDSLVRDNVARLRHGDDLKVVVAERGDFDWAVRRLRCEPVGRGVNILLSPADRQLEPAVLARWLLDSGLEARLQLQLHRTIWPDGSDGFSL